MNVMIDFGDKTVNLCNADYWKVHSNKIIKSNMVEIDLHIYIHRQTEIVRICEVQDIHAEKIKKIVNSSISSIYDAVHNDLFNVDTSEMRHIGDILSLVRDKIDSEEFDPKLEIKFK